MFICIEKLTNMVYKKNQWINPAPNKVCMIRNQKLTYFREVTQVDDGLEKSELTKLRKLEKEEDKRIK